MDNTNSRLISIETLMQQTDVKFGTSGIRGLVEQMTNDLCFKYTLAFIKALRLKQGSKIVLAIDLRPSSTRIAQACISAINYCGLNVEYFGVLPTPAMAYYCDVYKLSGIMITGSHIPFDRNGLKFYSENGEITKIEEALIKTQLVDKEINFKLCQLPTINSSGYNLYLNRYLDFFGKDSLKNITVGVYEHSSAAREILTDIISKLGGKVISINRTQEFVPIDTEAVSEADVQSAKGWSKQYQFDAIVSTDGDGDRPLIGDENGNWFRGDIVGLLTSIYLGVDNIVLPVSCNSAIEKSGYFNKVIRSRIGSPFVIEQMHSLIKNASLKVAGFEANGGFLLGTKITLNEKSLLPLCTRDSVLPILCLLASSVKNSTKISNLMEKLPKRFTASDRLQNIPVSISKELINHLSNDSANINQLFENLNLTVKETNNIDGLRITFNNNEIIHIRPSGNAPELRCYCEADSLKRVLYLVNESILVLSSYMELMVSSFNKV